MYETKVVFMEFKDIDPVTFKIIRELCTDDRFTVPPTAGCLHKKGCPLIEGCAAEVTKKTERLQKLKELYKKYNGKTSRELAHFIGDNICAIVSFRKKWLGH